MYDLVSGQASVDGGKSFGTLYYSLLIQGCSRISSVLGLFDGSLFSIYLIKSFALSDTAIVSGNV